MSSSSLEGTLRVAFDGLAITGDEMSVGVAPGNADKPVWTYWFPLLCYLSRGRILPTSVDALHQGARPFVYPVELRWEAIDWCAAGGRESIASIPSAVLCAARAGRAIVLVSFAHESRRLFDSARPEQTCVYDALALLADEHGLAPSQLWFVEGNYRGGALTDWLAARRLMSAPFTVRVCEPFSAFVAACARRDIERAGQPAVATRFERRSEMNIGWQATRLSIAPHPSSGFGDVTDVPTESPWRYACLNRAFRPHRWTVLGRLFRERILQLGLVSFPRPTAFNLTSVRCDPRVEECRELLNLLPLRIDRPFDLGEGDYFAQNAVAVGLPPRAVYACGIQLVTETQHSDDGLFLSEKTFKGLLGRGPMIVVGNCGSLEHLRSLGVETWGDLLDERYDELTDPAQRMDACLTTLLEVVRDAERLHQMTSAAAARRARNLDWLITARKPWDTLIDELARALAAGV